jgi:hypothetical protein
VSGNQTAELLELPPPGVGQEGTNPKAVTPPPRGRRGDLERRLLDLQADPNGVGYAIRTRLWSGRHEIVPASLDPFVALLGSDPYGAPVGTGLLVPSTPTSTFVPTGASPSQYRYLFLLAREQFNSGEQGVRLTGIRQYAELTATVPDLGTFKKEITSPLWHPPDGSISWHVMVIPKTTMVTRNVQNADSLVFRDAYGPALLYNTFAGPQFAPTAYTPPNGARPWGKPLASVSLGNMHDLRYRWRTGYLEQMLDIPLPLPCDVAFFASVRQNDPSTNPAASSLTANQFAALGPEDQFLTAYNAYAQYGRIAGSLVFDENLGEDVP